MQVSVCFGNGRAEAPGRNTRCSHQSRHIDAAQLPSKRIRRWPTNLVGARRARSTGAYCCSDTGSLVLNAHRLTIPMHKCVCSDFWQHLDSTPEARVCSCQASSCVIAPFLDMPHSLTDVRHTAAEKRQPLPTQPRHIKPAQRELWCGILSSVLAWQRQSLHPARTSGVDRRTRRHCATHPQLRMCCLITCAALSADKRDTRHACTVHRREPVHGRQQLAAGGQAVVRRAWRVQLAQRNLPEQRRPLVRPPAAVCSPRCMLLCRRPVSYTACVPSRHRRAPLHSNGHPLTRPVTAVCPAALGTSTDTTAPLYAQHPDGMEGHNEGRLRGVQVRRLELPVLAGRQLPRRLPAQRGPPLSHERRRLQPRAGNRKLPCHICSRHAAGTCVGTTAFRAALLAPLQRARLHGRTRTRCRKPPSAFYRPACMSCSAGNRRCQDAAMNGRRAAICRHAEGEVTPLSECLAAQSAREEIVAGSLRMCRLSCFERTLLRFGSAPPSAPAPEDACLIVVIF